MMEETAAWLGFGLPDDAGERFAELLAARHDRYLAANLTRDPGALDEFWMELGERTLGRYGMADRAEEFAEEAERRSYDPAFGWFAPFDDVAPCLAGLRKRGLRLAVVSNWDLSLPRVLAACGLDIFFDAVVPSLEFGPEKPDPRIFLRALALLDASPEEAAHVGDLVEDDVVGARSAGMQAVHLDREGKAASAIHTLAQLVV